MLPTADEFPRTEALVTTPSTRLVDRRQAHCISIDSTEDCDFGHEQGPDLDSRDDTDSLTGWTS